jgi:hypothetical protein
VASFIGGQLIGRDANGMVTNYWTAALVGALASLLAIALASRLVLHGAPPLAAAAKS